MISTPLRGILLPTTTILSVMFGFLSFNPVSHAAPRVELVSFWAAAAEKTAVAELGKAIEAEGGTWHSNPSNSFDEMREDILNRIIMKLPPDVSFWYGGDDLHEIAMLGAIHPIKNIEPDLNITSVLRKELISDISLNGQLMAIPIGIHLQNVSFYSQKIYTELGLALPNSWRDFLDQAPIIQKAGYTPLAISNTFWFHRLLFNSIMLERIDVQAYKNFYDPNTPINGLRPIIRETFDIYFKLRAYADQNHNALLWDDVAKLVANHRAATLVIGDYALPVFENEGRINEVDFLCNTGPGNASKWTYGIDIFIFPLHPVNRVSDGQRLFLNTVFKPEVQREYLKKKGGVTVINDDATIPNACIDSSQWGLSHIDLIADRGSRGNPRITGLNHLLERLWNEPAANPETATARLFALFDEISAHR